MRAIRVPFALKICRLDCGQAYSRLETSEKSLMPFSSPKTQVSNSVLAIYNRLKTTM